MLNRDLPYYDQVRLLVRTLPIIAQERVFALKGGTAINLFVREFPRLSVDIDLAYLPQEPRDQAIVNARAALSRIQQRLNALPNLQARLQSNNTDELRVVLSDNRATIKIEVSPVARGTLHQPIVMVVQEAVEDEFGFAEIQVVSLPDLYGGKLCAAMDRQHPRDLFDVRMLLQAEGINRELFTGFLTYVLSHSRPIHEVLSPRWKDLERSHQEEFVGMTRVAVSAAELIETREAMVAALRAQCTPRDKDFLLSFKRAAPDWRLFDQPSAAGLPAIRWKLANIQRLAANKSKHEQQVENLEAVLDKWLDSHA